MEMILFRTPTGEEFGVHIDDIRQVWTGQNEGEVVLVLIGEDKLTVAGDTYSILREIFDTTDLRPVRKMARTSGKPRLVK